MINITQDLGGGMPVIWIRFNPDSYKDYANNKCRGNTSERHSTLIKFINMCKNYTPTETLSVIYLYYDGYNPKKTEIHIVDMDISGITELIVTLIDPTLT